jgi:hypothetical protein
VADFPGRMGEFGLLYENSVQMAIEDQGQIAGFPVGMALADGGCGIVATLTSKNENVDRNGFPTYGALFSEQRTI